VTDASPNVRLRRLKSDHERILANLEGQKKIRLVKAFGTPPERYQLEYLVRSLIQDDKGVRERTTHQVEITLTRAYPRMAPQCRMLTPVFHPNIAPHAICIGDHWAAGETLASLVVRIGEMLAFQSYNLKSPLNGEAARWVAGNEAKLPLDDHDFASLLERGAAASAAAGAEAGPGAPVAAGAPVEEACANCARKFAREALRLCGARHLTCPDCIVPCGSCARVVCLRCRAEPCAECGALACIDCLGVCPGCQKRTCPKHRAACAVCGHAHCGDCSVECFRCKKSACIAHIVAVKGRDAHVCATCAEAIRAKQAQAAAAAQAVPAQAPAAPPPPASPA
jgi:ubiquitin-protein ligase